MRMFPLSARPKLERTLHSKARGRLHVRKVAHETVRVNISLLRRQQLGLQKSKSWIWTSVKILRAGRRVDTLARVETVSDPS